VPPGELDELPGPGQHGAALRRTDQRDTAAAPELEQALLPEQVKGSQDPNFTIVLAPPSP